MSFIGWMKGLKVVKDIGTSVADGINRGQERKHGNQENREVRQHKSDMAPINQFAKEFTENKNWFDSAINGINRLPRPLFALSALSIFVAQNSAPFVLLANGNIDYLMFMEIIQQMALEQKWIFLTIIGFYFGSRYAEKRQKKQALIDYSKYTKEVPKVDRRNKYDFETLKKDNFSNTSMSRLNTCHEDFHKILAVACSIKDFSVLEGTRTLEQQQKYFANGKSKLDGVKRKSKHQSSPSMAVDIAPTPIDWKNTKPFYELSKIMFDVATELKEAGEISHRLRWGGDWDSDGDYTDQTFNDLPHYELV